MVVNHKRDIMLKLLKISIFDNEGLIEGLSPKYATSHKISLKSIPLGPLNILFCFAIIKVRSLGKVRVKK